MANNVDIVISAKDYATKTLDNIKKQFFWLEKQAQKSTGWIKNMWNSLTNLIKIGWWLYIFNKIEQVSDSFTNMQNALQQVSSWNELDILQKKILTTANNARVPVEALTKSFVRFDLVNKQMWGSQDETLKIMDSLSKWLTLSWASAQETASSVLQLSQAFGSWVLQWDEFRSLAENMPMLMDVLAKSMWVPRWQLKELASEWKITSAIIKDALLQANTQINEQFNKSQVTIWWKITQIKNDILMAFWEFDKNTWFTKWIVNELQKITVFFDTLKPRAKEFIENSIIIKNTLLRFWEAHPTLVKIAAWITWIAAALLILNANPIWALITAFVLLIANWEKVKLNLGWGLYFMMKDFKAKFDAIISYFTNFRKNFIVWFEMLVQQSRQWGVNLIQMFVDWIKSWIKSVTDAVSSVATTVSDYLGFHSPTKKWPWSDADKWMPNLVKMLAEWLWQTSPIEAKSLELAKAIWSGLSKEKMQELADNIKLIWENAMQTFNWLWSDILWANERVKTLKLELKGIASEFVNMKAKWKEELDKLKINFEELKVKWQESIRTLTEEMDKLVTWLWSIKSQGVNDIAKRVLEIQDRQLTITTELQNQNATESEKNKLLAEQLKLSQELALAKWNVSDLDIEKTKAELNKSATQKILDKISTETTAQELAIKNQQILIDKKNAQNIIDEAVFQKQITDKETQLQKDLADIQTRWQAKNDELKKENDLYINLVDQKTAIDNLYFDNFGIRIKAQQTEIQKTLTMLAQLNSGWSSGWWNIIDWKRALGWPVWAWKTYLVWERGPELFTPNWGGSITPNNQLWWSINININMWWVTTNNWTDINNIADIITQKITRSLQLQKLGIS